MADYDAIIVGGGPAALTAGIYMGRSDYKTLVISNTALGGSIVDIELIENYPGFPGGISGSELAAKMAEQMTMYGVDVLYDEVKSIEVFSSSIYVNTADGAGFSTRGLILAGGTKHRHLGVTGDELPGIAYCTFCDGGHFVGKEVVICGGGNQGMTSALHMAKLASKVTVVERDEIRAESILQQRAAADPKITVMKHINVNRVVGTEKVEGLECYNRDTRDTFVIPCEGIFVNIGQIPVTEFLDDAVETDHGFIVTDEKFETDEEFIFAAGDIRSNTCRQIAVAVGEGASAAMRLQEKLH